MRKLAALVLLTALMAMPVAAAPVDVDHGPSISTRVLEIVTGWLAWLGNGFDPIDAKDDPDDGDRDDPPLNGIGPEWDPVG